MSDGRPPPERGHVLLDAVLTVASELDLDKTLERIVQAACELADAQYGALGVLASDGTRLGRFITHGVTPEERRAIGEPPHGHGVLGVLIHDPKPLRLHDVRTHPMAHGIPKNHPEITTFLGVPIRTGHQVYGNLYLGNKHGGVDFTEDDENTVVALAAAAGMAIDNAQLYEQSTRRRRAVEAAAEITEAVLDDANRIDVLTLVVHRARELVEAELAVLFLVDDDTELLVEVVAGKPANVVAGSRLPIGGSVAGQVVRSGKPIVIDHVHALGRVTSDAYAPPSGWPDIGPAMYIPMSSPSGVLGVLMVAADPDGQVDPSEERLGLLGTFAGHAALALERAQAREKLAQLAVYEDRDRIARDLHDTVIQRLFATGLQLQGVSRRITDADAVDRVNRAVDELDATIRDIREAIFELRNRQPASITAQLREVIRSAKPVLGYTPRLTLNGDVDSVVPPELGPHLVAVLREALSNVARHASATLVEVQLDVGRTLTLHVLDNGKGINPDHRESGLRNIRERAKALGGELELLPARLHGTELRWSVPLPATA
jgi:signal transduction histidine kinase